MVTKVTIGKESTKGGQISSDSDHLCLALKIVLKQLNGSFLSNQVKLSIEEGLDQQMKID